jgi:hypothetical protein
MNPFLNPWLGMLREWQAYWWGFFWPHFDKQEERSLKIVGENLET